MQLAVITDEFDVDVQHAFDVMAEYGVKAAEIRTIWDKNIADAPDDYIERLGAVARDNGVTIVGIATPFFKCDLPGLATSADPAKGPMHSAADRSYDEQMLLLRRCIEIAVRLDVRLIRTFTFWKSCDLSPAVEDAIVAAYAEPARLAEEAGVTLIVENEHSCFIGTGEETARILNRINSPFVKSVWDPGNALMAGEEAFPAGYEYVKSFVEHVHVKDGNRDSGWTVVGEGVIDWPGQIQALADNGYTGYLSLETHYRNSDGAEASSRACLVNLVEMLKSAA